MQSSSILIEPDEEDLLGERFTTACRTKEGKIPKSPPIPKVPQQRHLQLHEVFNPGTWLMDLVKFGEAWYLFFVEGNTRYLIIKEASIIKTAPGTYTVPDNQRVRIKATDFLKVFREFINQDRPKREKCLIADSEKAFWADSMMTTYRAQSIHPVRVNVKRDGLNRLSVFDRIVRTIRDMAYQTDATATVYPPETIKQLAVIYHNTKHSTLSKLLSYQDDIKNVSQGVSPSDMFHHPILENYFVSILFAMNHSKITITEGFYIDDGATVLVRDDLNKRRNTYPGTWVIQKHKGQTYTVKCLETGEELNVARDRMRVFR